MTMSTTASRRCSTRVDADAQGVLLVGAGAGTVALAGLDTIHISADCAISEAVRAKLDTEKEVAQLAAKGKTAHCPDWLGAQVLPHGTRGGYGHLLETDDFTVKVLGKGIPHRPGLYVELRSHFLHTHPLSPRGACKEALCWIREQLLYDQEDALAGGACSFETVRLSRADLHADWQGGWIPAGEPDPTQRFIKPARVRWHAYHDGSTFTGFVFGSGSILARIYNKGLQARQRNDDAYPALLSARNPTTFDPTQDVWRLEFQLRREGTTGFRLYTEPDVDDDEATIETELAAEELPHLGTLPRFFRYQDDLWRYLTTHWLRLVVDDGTTNRARWPVHATWARLRDDFERVAGAAALTDEASTVVRGARFSGKSRILRRMLLGVVNSLEVEDAAPAAAALAEMQRWSERVAAREAERAAERRARYAERYSTVPSWVERGMGAHLERVEQIRHRVQMLLGIFGARGVLPLHLKPAHSVGDLLTQHLDDLEAEAEVKGGVGQVLADHFARVYKVSAPRKFFASLDEAA
jgi:hypothetical protein